MTNSRWLEIGAFANSNEHPVIDLGPFHPSRAGLLRCRVELNDNVIESVDLEPGHMHRAAEKLFEVRDYRQVLMLADRHDWQAPFSGELAVALTCEAMLGLIPPQRATLARTLLAEQARITSHLGFLTYVPHALGDESLSRNVRDVRESGRKLMLALSGNRLHPMLNRLGGMAFDLSAEWLAQLRVWLDDVQHSREALEQSQGTSKWSDLSINIGVVTNSMVNQFGLSGPISRAVGHGCDLRRITNHLAYDQLGTFGVEASTNGDAHARFGWLTAEIDESVRLINELYQLLDETPGPVSVKLSKIIRLPDGELWHSIEAPLGVAGVHIVSRGEGTPWRLKLRTPTFANVSALNQLLVGARIDQVAMIIASMGYTIGDLDK